MIERGSKVISKKYGVGVVVNIPIKRINVRFSDGTIRYFWPADVQSGELRAA